MLINVDRVLCIGAAPCVAIAGNVFQLDDEGKAIVVGPSTDDTNTHLAAEACPVRAIFLYDDNKNQLFPPIADMARAYVDEHPTAANDNASAAPAPAAPATTPAAPAAAPSTPNQDLPKAA